MTTFDDSEIDDIRSRLGGVIESLDELTFRLLREASREAAGRPAADKTLVQARRAVEKAYRLLGSLIADE